MDIEDAIVGDEPLSYESPISQDLKDLIEDSKSYEADQRPTFTQIIERMIDKKLSLVCGSNTDLVDPDAVIRGVSSMAIQLKMKASEAETIRKQLTQMKIKN